MPKSKPKCVTLYPWLKANLGLRCLAPLTGTDYRSLDAAVMIVETWAYNRSNEDLAQAFGLCVRQMQHSTQYFAYHAIAHVAEWDDRGLLFLMAALEMPRYIPVCLCGPGGAKALR